MSTCTPPGQVEKPVSLSPSCLSLTLRSKASPLEVVKVHLQVPLGSGDAALVSAGEAALAQASAMPMADPASLALARSFRAKQCNLRLLRIPGRNDVGLTSAHQAGYGAECQASIGHLVVRMGRLRWGRLFFARSCR